MRESLRYVLAALATGLVAVWGSENLFWTAPPADLDVAGWLLTWIAYALCCAAVLSAVRWSGLGGVRALLLGGAVLGFLVEGVLVGTMYEAFPLQVVWTPLAWHALVTGVAVFGVSRAGPRWSVGRQLAALTGLGLAAGTFGLWWPAERDDLPGVWVLLGYLAGVGLVVPAAQVVLERLGPPGRRGTVPSPPRAVGLVAPVLLTLLWVAQTVAAPSPVRLVLPVVLGLTLLAMRRLGEPGPVRLGGPAPLARHALFVVAPLVAAAVPAIGWPATGGVGTNVVFALVTGTVAAASWLRLVVPPRPRRAAAA